MRSSEPKVKFYFDVRESIGDTETFSAASSRAAKTLENLRANFLSILIKSSIDYDDAESQVQRCDAIRPGHVEGFSI